MPRKVLTQIGEVEEARSTQPVVSDVRPGQIVGGFKRPWTAEDQRKVYGTVTFVPAENFDFTVNGVRWSGSADVPIEVPRIVLDELLRTRMQDRHNEYRKRQFANREIGGVL